MVPYDTESNQWLCGLYSWWCEALFIFLSQCLEEEQYVYYLWTRSQASRGLHISYPIPSNFLLSHHGIDGWYVYKLSLFPTPNMWRSISLWVFKDNNELQLYIFYYHSWATYQYFTVNVSWELNSVEQMSMNWTLTDMF